MISGHVKAKKTYNSGLYNSVKTKKNGNKG